MVAPPLSPSDSSSLDVAKLVSRKELRARRRAIAEISRRLAAEAGASHVLAAPELAGALVVAAFLGVRDEIDTAPLIERLLAAGHLVVLPRVIGRGQPLDFHLWRPGEMLEEAALGVLQPVPASPRLFPDLVVAPVLGFDLGGRRLGYGGGFYDRTLRLLRHDRQTPVIGFAFELQRLDEVPAGPCDERLDCVATEAALHDCRGAI